MDVDFVRKAVRAIGRLAVKIESASDKCITALLELIQTKVNYVVQEAIIVIRVRKFLSLICFNMFYRTFSENTLINMRALFLHYVKTWMILMNRKQRLL